VHKCESPGGTCACPWHLALKERRHNTAMACAKRRLRGSHSTLMNFNHDPPDSLADLRAAREAGRAAAAALQEEGAAMGAGGAAAAAAAAAVLEAGEEAAGGQAAPVAPPPPRRSQRRLSLPG